MLTIRPSPTGHSRVSLGARRRWDSLAVATMNAFSSAARSGEKFDGSRGRAGIAPNPEPPPRRDIRVGGGRCLWETARPAQGRHFCPPATPRLSPLPVLTARHAGFEFSEDAVRQLDRRTERRVRSWARTARASGRGRSGRSALTRSQRQSFGLSGLRACAATIVRGRQGTAVLGIMLVRQPIC